MNYNQHILFKNLKEISPENVKRILDKEEIDPAVGISIAKMDLEHIEFEDMIYYTYAARVMPKTIEGRQPFVTPHFHKRGCEPYYFLGNGEMNLGYLSDDGKSCQWKKPMLVKSGGQILIRENEIHCFRNIGNKNSDFLFACPLSHLVDFSERNIDGDRHIVKNLKNGIPTHFQNEIQEI